jgi:dihydroorotate dehydrogenase electron transfer subunit
LALHTNPENNRAVKVIQVFKETFDIWTLTLDTVVHAIPGQYIMVWIPGIDEVPMSLSSISPVAITVRVVGEATKALSLVKPGDKVGIRGPFGNGYSIKPSKALLIGGGTGIASLLPLAEKIIERGLKPSFLMGARSEDQLIFLKNLQKIFVNNLFIATDDGSIGFKGYASNYFDLLLQDHKFDTLYMCGPELMMFKIFQTAELNNIPVQASMERYCKCAIGLCGSCAIGPYRVCVDGPVFNSEMLRNVQNEFAKVKMDPSGKLIPVDH